jgi:hypothetical protein
MRKKILRIEKTSELIKKKQDDFEEALIRLTKKGGIKNDV